MRFLFGCVFLFWFSVYCEFSLLLSPHYFSLSLSPSHSLTLSLFLPPLDQARPLHRQFCQQIFIVFCSLSLSFARHGWLLCASSVSTTILALSIYFVLQIISFFRLRCRCRRYELSVGCSPRSVYVWWWWNTLTRATLTPRAFFTFAFCVRFYCILCMKIRNSLFVLYFIRRLCCCCCCYSRCFGSYSGLGLRFVLNMINHFAYMNCKYTWHSAADFKIHTNRRTLPTNYTDMYIVRTHNAHDDDDGSEHCTMSGHQTSELPGRQAGREEKKLGVCLRAYAQRDQFYLTDCGLRDELKWVWVCVL